MPESQVLERQDLPQNQIEKIERTPEDIQAGQERIRKQFEAYNKLRQTHLIQEQKEREGLDESMEQAFRELDNSPVGKFYKKASGGTTLSEAKQTWWGTIGANTLQGGQALANIVIHPIQTTKAVGQFVAHPWDSTKEVASMYKNEWNSSNAWGKTGIVWRGAFEVVFGAKGASTISKVGRLGYKSGQVGKLGGTVQKGLEFTGNKISELTPEIVTKTLGGASVAMNKVAEKIPEGARATMGNITKTVEEQSKIRVLDNPLNKKLSSFTPETTALVVGEGGVMGEKVLEISKAISQATTVQEILDSVGVIGKNLKEIPPKQTIELLNKIPEKFVKESGGLSKEVYRVRQEVLQSNPHVFSEQTYTKKGVPEEKTDWEHLSKTENWTPERQKIHTELFNSNYEASVELSKRMPPKTIVLMRGNTGVGKTSVLKGRSNSRYPEFAQKLDELNILDENGVTSGVLNPDDIKGQLRSFDKKDGKHSISHSQVLREGAKINEEVISQLFEEGHSMVLDKRFLTIQEVDSVLKRSDGYDIILIDVDASLENSLARVKNRTFDGDDPIVDPDRIEDGFNKMNDDREKIKNMSRINKYYLINTD